MLDDLDDNNMAHISHGRADMHTATTIRRLP